jgi:hypothetical protein
MPMSWGKVMWGHSEKAAIYNPGKGPHQKWILLTLWLWTFNLQNYHKINSCHISHSSHGIFYSFIHMYIHCLGHFSPMLPAPSLSPHPPHFRQNLFCPLLQFCWREDISNNKKDTVFLLVWDKDSCTERFLACFHAYMYYNPNWFISTRPLHYFPVTFP